MLRAEILSIGDELLIGQIVNTNAAFLSTQLNAVGVEVRRITTCGDSRRELRQAVSRAWKESDIVIATGGLGPTHDDISKDVVEKFFGKKLQLDTKTLARVKARFKKFGYKHIPESNIGQAMVPKDFVALENDQGTAPGLLYHENGKTFVILAGVPQEMKHLMTAQVIPYLQKKYKGKFGQVIKHKTLLTTGIGESLLAERIGDTNAFVHDGATLAFLPSVSALRLRISVRAPSAQKADSEIASIERFIRSRAEQFIFGVNEETLEHAVVYALRRTKQTLSVAESCTGGLLSEKITSISGASNVFPGGITSYDNSVKMRELGVSKRILDTSGAVSKECAAAMSEGARKKFGTTFALSVTGIAGPGGGTKTKPVGTVWIALAEKGKPTQTKLLQTTGSRDLIRERSVYAALEMLRRRLFTV